MNTLVLIGGGFLLLVGLIVATAKLAAKAENERIRRWLSEQTNEKVAEKSEKVAKERSLSHEDWKASGRKRRESARTRKPR